MFRSIRLRVTAIFFSVTALFLFLLGLYLIDSMEKFIYENTQGKLVLYAKIIAEDLKEPFARQPYGKYFEDYARSTKNDINARVTIIDKNGSVLGDSTFDKDTISNQADRPEIKAALNGEQGKDVRYVAVQREKLIFVSVPVKSEQDVLAAVRVSVPWSEVEAGQSLIRWSIATAILLALVLTLIVASSFTNSLVTPLQEMTRVAQEMAEGRLDTTLNVTSDDEIGALSRGLNYMAYRLRDNIRQITEEKNKVKAILTSMNDGVIAVDSNANILLINPPVERMFNIKYENSVGKSVIEVVRNFDLEKLLHSALDSDEAISREIQMFVPDPKTFRVSMAPLTSERGVVGVVAVLRDITAFREVERMKTDFVANVSHELRTPLTSIKGFVETLLDGALDERETARHFLEIINDEADRLNRLISDLLSLSKIEAKQREIHKVPFNMGQLIKNTVSMLSPQANDKNISMEMLISETMPVIEADEDMVGQLMINLLDNAIKYTPQGGRVEISAEVWEDGGIRVSVSDSGIGIPRESIPRLFERFYRVDKARSREMGGTGLGLAIVKHILEVHNGKIEVDSRVGRGSVFTFYLPAD